MKIVWRRAGSRRKHTMPGELTEKQFEEIKSMLNIANWFMDVEAEVKKEKPDA